MATFAVTLEGRGIRLPINGEANPIIGFLATRVVRAKSSDKAIETAKVLVLEEWKAGEHADANTGSIPELSVDAIFQPSWFQVFFRRISSKGYTFYTQDD